MEGNQRTGSLGVRESGLDVRREYERGTAAGREEAAPQLLARRWRHRSGHGWLVVTLQWGTLQWLRGGGASRGGSAGGGAPVGSDVALVATQLHAQGLAL